MAGRAATGDAAVIHRRAGECGEVGCGVARLARRAGRHVVRRLRLDRDAGEALAAVVTARAAGGDPGVNHRGSRSKGRRRLVTHGAIGARGDVARSLRLRRHAIERRPGRRRCVAGRATAADAAVVHRGAGERGEVACRVARLARRAGRHVVRRLRLEIRHPGEALAGVVTGRAAGGDAGVDHQRPRTERGGGLVTRRAVCRRRDVARCPAAWVSPRRRASRSHLPRDTSCNPS